MGLTVCCVATLPHHVTRYIPRGCSSIRGRSSHSVGGVFGISPPRPIAGGRAGFVYFPNSSQRTGVGRRSTQRRTPRCNASKRARLRAFFCSVVRVIALKVFNDCSDLCIAHSGYVYLGACRGLLGYNIPRELLEHLQSLLCW